MQPLTKPFRNLRMLMQGAVTGISNMKYAIYPDTRKRSLSSIETAYGG